MARRYGSVPDLEQLGAFLDDGSGTRVQLRLSKRVMDDWQEVAPEPWTEGAEPLVILGGELVVRATTAHGVRLLRYAAGDLLAALHQRYGVDAITEIRVVAPSGRATS